MVGSFEAIDDARRAADIECGMAVGPYQCAGTLQTEVTQGVNRFETVQSAAL